MIWIKIGPAPLAILAAIAATVPCAHGQIDLDIVAVTGEYAKGGGGGQFSQFDRPALNASGDIAFRASMNPGFGGVTEENKTGIWRKRPHSQVHKIARADEYAPTFKPYGPQPEVTNSRFSTLADPLLGPDGRVTFFSHLKIPSESTFIGAHNNEMVWSMKELSVGMLDVAQEKGSKAPMIGYASGQQSILDASGKRTWFHVIRPPAVMADGAVVFTASLQMNGFDGKSGIWFYRKPPGQDPSIINPNFVLIEDEEPVPGVPSGASFREFLGITLTPDDTCVFHAFLDVGVGPIAEQNAEGIWKKQVGGALEALAVAGSPAAGIADHLWAELGKPAVNAGGDTAFRATLLSPDPTDPVAHREGIWLASGGSSPTPVALEGQGATGFSAPFVFESFADPSIAADGNLAFAADVRDATLQSTEPVSAVFFRSSAGLALIAKSGDLAPGAGGTTFRSFGTPLVGGAGRIAFSAELAPSPNSPGGHGLWTTTSSGALGLVALTGIILDVPDRGPSTVQWIEPTEVNSGGQLAFRLRFDGGAEAVGIASSAPQTVPDFDTWAESEIPDPALRDADRDPDGDGIPNFLELAFGGDPMAPDPSRSPSSTTGANPADGSPTLELAYFELSNPGPLRYTIEASSNLFNWSPAETIEVARSLQSDGSFLVRVREQNPPADGSSRFLRVRVSDS